MKSFCVIKSKLAGNSKLYPTETSKKNFDASRNATNPGTCVVAYWYTVPNGSLVPLAKNEPMIINMPENSTVTGRKESLFCVDRFRNQSEPNPIRGITKN